MTASLCNACQIYRLNSIGICPTVEGNMVPGRKLRAFIVSTRTEGGTINKHVIYGILMGLIRSDLGRYGQYLNFVVTNGWLQSLYQRMNLTRRIVTTSRPAITKATWLEVKAMFLHDIMSAIVEEIKFPMNLF